MARRVPHRRQFRWHIAAGLSVPASFPEIDCFYYYGVAKYCFVNDKSEVIDRPMKPLILTGKFMRRIVSCLEANEQQLPDARNNPQEISPRCARTFTRRQKPQAVSRREIPELPMGAGNFLPGLRSQPGPGEPYFGLFRSRGDAFTWTESPDAEVRLMVPPRTAM